MNHRAFLLVLGVGMIACGGGASSPSSTPAAATGTDLAATASNWFASLVISAPSTATAGATGLTASVTPLTGTTFQWSIKGGTIQGSSTGLSVAFTATQVGTLTLSCTATHGTASSTGTVAIEVKGALPAPPRISAPATVNAGVAGLSASATGATGETFNWILSGPGTPVSGTNGQVLVFNAGSPGLLNLTCTASNAYGSTSAQAAVQVQGVAPGAVAITAPATVAANSAGLSASVPAQTGCSYAWTIQGGTLTSATTPTATFSAGAGGTLSLGCTVTNAYGATSAQTQVQVASSAPTTPVIAAPSQTHALSTANVASVQTQTGCSYAWTVSGGTLDGGQGTPSITFTAGAAGTLGLKCAVTNAARISASAQADVAVLAYQFNGYYGSGLNVDALANTPVGKSVDFQVSYRIRANHSGALKAIRPFFIWSDTTAGYALGTGGTIQVQIQSDDGSAAHNPSGSVLASLVYAKPVNEAVGFYPLLAFASQPKLTAGALYHVVFTNIDPDPVNNWVCLDSAYMDYANTPMQPTVADLDMATLWRQGATGTWAIRRSAPTESFTPILELDYADGASQGQGYMEFWIGGAKTISGAKGVRQTFTVSGSDRIVSSASVRVKYVSGSSPLTIRLEKADGTLIDQETVSKVAVTPGLSGASWAKVAFPTPRTLQAGQAYNLVLSAPADTVFTAYPMRKGSDKGYKSTTLFTDGYAQFNSGTGWTGWDQWGGVNRKDGDLQFFFEVVK